MIYFLLFLFSITLFIYDKKRIPYYLFPLSLLFDLSLGFVETSRIENIFQPSLFIATTLIFARSYLKKLTNVNFFLLYIFVLLVTYLATVEIRLSAIRMFTIIFVCYYMYYVGYKMAYDKKSLYYIKQSVSAILVICIMFFFLAQILNLERYLVNTYQYSEITADLGTLGAQTIHTLSLCAILFFVLNYYIKSKPQIIDHIILSLSIFIIFIVFRRTAILLLLIGLSTFVFLCGKKNFARIILFFVPILVLFFIINFSDLAYQFEHRLSTKMKTVEDIQREGRILEYQHYWEFLSDINLAEFLFGNNSFFETRDFGRKFYGRERPIHTDYIFILYSAGIIGLLLLLLLYYSFFQILIKIPTVKKSIENYFKNIAIVLLFTNIIVMSLGGGFRHLTYVSFLMFNVGFFQSWLVVNVKKSTSTINRRIN